MSGTSSLKFVRLGERGREIPAVQDGAGRTFDLRPLTDDIDGGFLATGGISRAAAAILSRSLPELLDASSMRFGAPVASPGAVICIGQNYAAHAGESGSQPPVHPILFFKHPNTVVGPNDDVRIPPGATRVDWEVELAVIIGSQARYLPDERSAMACIAGYAISNDVSERTYQLEISGGQWSKGKSSETFNPLGPFLVPAAGLAAPTMRMRSSVNGEPRQDSTTADMIFSVAHLVWSLSQFLVLEPGNIINTGTPQGVALSGRFPYLVAGDIVECSIEDLGAQRQRLVHAPMGQAGEGGARTFSCSDQQIIVYDK